MVCIIKSYDSKQAYSGLIPANPFQIQDNVNKIPKTEVKYRNNSFPVLCDRLLQIRGMERYFRSRSTIPRMTSRLVITLYRIFPLFPGVRPASQGSTSPRIRLFEICRRRLYQMEYSMAI